MSWCVYWFSLYVSNLFFFFFKNVSNSYDICKCRRNLPKWLQRLGFRRLSMKTLLEELLLSILGWSFRSLHFPITCSFSLFLFVFVFSFFHDLCWLLYGKGGMKKLYRTLAGTVPSVGLMSCCLLFLSDRDIYFP